jgi:FlaG/FlaF family flagellin (archaellin)
VKVWKSRRGVSELYATVLMVGATVVFGGLVVAAAITQSNASQYSSFLAASSQQAASGKLISMVYSSVFPGSGGCTQAYGGFKEGTSYTLALYNYGTNAFAPVSVYINGTLYAGSGYPSVAAGGLTAYSFTTPSCVHASGQTFTLVEAGGNEVSIGT